jgi:nucleotide-binding universal stress UspA family protein
MKPTKVLLPLDIQKCPREIFGLTRRFVEGPEVTLILLHVIQPSRVAASSQGYRALETAARGCLERLAEENLEAHTTTVLHVRFGVPAEQIIQEAKDENVQLIILPTYGSSFWSRLISLWKPNACRLVSPLAEKLIRNTTCGLFLAGVRSRFNCESVWTQLASEGAALHSRLRVRPQQVTYDLELSGAQQNPQTARQSSPI